MADEKNERLAETKNPDGSITRREWTPSERYMLFEAGFRTGAGNRAVDERRLGLGAYKRGLEEGRKARAEALTAYARELNYQPSLLRHGPPQPEDPFHNNGRCTCTGEGRCEWCKRASLKEAIDAPKNPRRV